MCELSGTVESRYAHLFQLKFNLFLYNTAMLWEAYFLIK